jgi:hypothetical protein
MSAADPWFDGVVRPLIGDGPLPPKRAREAAAPRGDEPVRIIVNALDAETRPLSPMERQAIEQRRTRVAQEAEIIRAVRAGESPAAIGRRMGMTGAEVGRIARRAIG